MRVERRGREEEEEDDFRIGWVMVGLLTEKSLMRVFLLWMRDRHAASFFEAFGVLCWKQASLFSGA